MKTFDDLKFTKHRVTKKAIMASLELKPNVFISVVAGEGMYSTSRKGVRAECTKVCLLYTSPSPRDRQKSRMPSSA